MQKRAQDAEERAERSDARVKELEAELRFIRTRANVALKEAKD
jgi:hypothetical protein